jgi:hypothetical protein
MVIATTGGGGPIESGGTMGVDAIIRTFAGVC